MFKKNKNLHRALVALIVLGCLVCTSFVLWAGAEEAPAADTAPAVVTSAEDKGAQSNGEALQNFLDQTGIMQLIRKADWRAVIMVVISFVLMYLAIAKGFEPLLLLPIAFGILLTNLPGAGMFHSEIFEDGHVHWDLIRDGVTVDGTNESAGLIDILYLGVKLGIYPCLIFIGVGAMTDFGPLIANPKSLLLGAAAQLGIFMHLASTDLNL